MTNHDLARMAAEKCQSYDTVNFDCIEEMTRDIGEVYAAPMAELELSKAMLVELRRVNVQGETLRTLVKCAFACGEISDGRAAELLGISVQEWRDRYGEIPQGEGLEETLEKLHGPHNEVA